MPTSKSRDVTLILAVSRIRPSASYGANFSLIKLHFYWVTPASALYAVIHSFCVCLSIHLLQVGVLPKRLNIEPRKQRIP